MTKKNWEFTRKSLDEKLNKRRRMHRKMRKIDAEIAALYKLLEALQPDG